MKRGHKFSAFWGYTAGTWKPLSPHSPMDENMRVEPWLEVRGGYSTRGHHLFGKDASTGATVYAHETEGWIVALYLDNRAFWIYLDTLPDYTAFLREEIAPLSALYTRGVVNNLRDIIAKLFNVWRRLRGDSTVLCQAGAEHGRKSS